MICQLALQAYQSTAVAWLCQLPQQFGCQNQQNKLCSNNHDLSQLRKAYNSLEQRHVLVARSEANLQQQVAAQRKTAVACKVQDSAAPCIYAADQTQQLMMLQVPQPVFSYYTETGIVTLH